MSDGRLDVILEKTKEKNFTELTVNKFSKTLEKSKEERLIDSMEKKFMKAFDLLGTANDMKKVHAAYDLLFECKNIYRHLKEEKENDNSK